MRALLGGAAMTVVLGGCAAGPEIIVESWGATPNAATFNLLGDGDPVAMAAVRSQLEASGWRFAAQSPSVLVEVSRARRNERAGAFTAETRPQPEGDWEARPAPARWWRREGERRDVVVTLIRPATGERLAAARTWTARDAGRTPDDRLTTEAIAALVSRTDPYRQAGR